MERISLSPYFQQITWKSYEDELIVTDAEPLISYILSCHGNQNQYLPDRYKDFRALVKKKNRKWVPYHQGCRGAFLCEKSNKLEIIVKGLEGNVRLPFYNVVTDSGQGKQMLSKIWQHSWTTTKSCT